jgi:hypothetical protein
MTRFAFGAKCGPEALCDIAAFASDWLNSEVNAAPPRRWEPDVKNWRRVKGDMGFKFQV